jgi:DNA-binding XRE family transcriptional regulator
MDVRRTRPDGELRRCIGAWRHAFARSQHDLARCAGLDRKTMMRAEARGVARPETVRRPARVFGVTPLRRDQDPRPEDLGDAVPRMAPKPGARA